ncbi:NADH dehydrogenase [Thalassocella blandensis]|nr:NADH dehydrogenase [Thalassocella blandensis]
MNDKQHKVVIVGGGAGGLILATRLAKHAKRSTKQSTNLSVTLVDESLTHIWKPLLHEIAAGSLNSYEDEMSYLSHAARHHYDFQLGKFSRIDRQQKLLYLDEVYDSNGNVLIEARTLKYDSLVFAIGSTNNDFGTPGVKEHCFMLDNRKNAEYFHTHFIGKFLAARAKQDNESLVHINIVGGGATGVELAGEIYSTMKRIVTFGLKDFNLDRIKICVIEAGNTILVGQTEKVQKGALKELKKIGIDVKLNSKVSEVNSTTIVIDESNILPSSLSVWAAGISGSMNESAFDGLALNRVKQIVVNAGLQSHEDESIFAIGDCAECVVDGNRLAPRAQVAQQQAIFLADNFMGFIDSNNMPEFVFREKGSLITIGESDAVGNIFASIFGSFYVQGAIAKWAYLSLYRQHQLQTLGVYRTIIQVLKDSMTRVLGPKIKLH